MKVELKSDFPITDEASLAATGATLKTWFERLAAKPEFDGKRRDATQWMYAENGKDIWWATTTWVEWDASRGVVKKDGKAEGYTICSTKTVAASIPATYELVKATIAGDSQGTLIRDRENKDLRYKWQTTGVSEVTDIDVAFTDNKGKTLITLTQARIQTRDEADGLRTAWGELFSGLKKELES